MGSSPPKYPGLSDEEKALLGSQTDILNTMGDTLSRQSALQSGIMPLLLQRAGIEAYTDDAGQTNYRFTTDASIDQQRYREYVSTLFDRQMAALRGELPLDAGLKRSLDDAEQQMKERLYRQLGPDWQLSSAGITQMGEFQQRRMAAEDAARRGDIEQFSNMAGNIAQSASPQSALAGYGALMQLSSPNPAAVGLSGAYGNILGQYAGERANDYQNSLMRYQQRGQLYGALVGSLLGAVGGYFGGQGGAQAGQQSGQAIGMMFA